MRKNTCIMYNYIMYSIQYYSIYNVVPHQIREVVR